MHQKPMLSVILLASFSVGSWLTFTTRTTNKVRLCEQSEPQSEPSVGQARRRCSALL